MGDNPEIAKRNPVPVTYFAGGEVTWRNGGSKAIRISEATSPGTTSDNLEGMIDPLVVREGQCFPLPVRGAGVINGVVCAEGLYTLDEVAITMAPRAAAIWRPKRETPPVP